MIKVSVVLFFLSGFMESFGESKVQPEKRYTKVPNGYLMVLRQHDNLFRELEKFVNVEKIPSTNFTGMGFVSVTFGFFDFKTKKYTKHDFVVT